MNAPTKPSEPADLKIVIKDDKLCLCGHIFRTQPNIKELTSILGEPVLGYSITDEVDPRCRWDWKKFGISAFGRKSGSVSSIDIWLVNQNEELREREYPFDDVIREVKVGQLTGQFNEEIVILGLTCDMTDVRTRRDFLSTVVHAGNFLDVSDPREVSRNAHLNHRLAKRYKLGDVSSSTCVIHLVLNERDISANCNGFTAYVVGFEFANFNSPQPKPSLIPIGQTGPSQSSSGRKEKSHGGSLQNNLLREFKIGGAREAGAKFVEGLFGWLFKGMGCLVSLIVTLIGIYFAWRFLRS